ncbi:glycerophosphodiester phosphodiesterase [Longivirga aurantiaca]|uniref:Glycerophosphodiester phosphodiesterase n=1 Tax=Longivirga aurantiaca TaxID=1837743 RepID=A0ABW1T5Q6_9ACTN
MRPQVVAHRGSSADAPEHTLDAYLRALADGADALECDVRLTADGHLVCVHDRTIDRTSDGRGVVSVMTLDELHDHDFGAYRKEQAPLTRRERRRQAMLSFGRDFAPFDSGPFLVAATGTSAGVSAEKPEAGGRDGAGPMLEDEPLVMDEARHRVLTLDRLLELVLDSDREVGLAIETKHPTRYAGLVEERVAQTLRRFGLARPRTENDQRIRVMSFSQLSVRRMRAMTPGLPTVFLMERVPLRFRDGSLPFGARIAGPSIDIVRQYPRYVDRVHRQGNAVHVWTVDDPADVELCVRLGVDAIISNHPRMVAEHLGL